MPSTAAPTAAPMINWAIVPTTISDRAVEMRSQIESRLAISARPNQKAASAQTLVMCKSPARMCNYPRSSINVETMSWRSWLVLRI